MKNFSNSENYKKAQTYSGGGQIPLGGYKCIIKGVKEVSFDWGGRLEMAFDITHGEQKDFFKNQFDSNTSEDKKWKGVFRLNIPNDDGTEADGWTMSRFKTTMEHFEDSNDGYTWNWDENTLKGKVIGIIFRRHYTVIEGKDVCYHEAFRTAPISAIESGKFKIPDDFYDKRWKEAHGNATAASVNRAETDENDFMKIDTSTEAEELPW